MMMHPPNERMCVIVAQNALLITTNITLHRDTLSATGTCFFNGALSDIKQKSTCV